MTKKRRFSAIRIVPGLVATTFFMQMLDTTILNTALPAIAASIHESPLRIQSVVIVYIAAVAFFIPLSGWLTDYIGSRKVFLSAILLFTVGSIFCAASQSLSQLVLSRIFQGVGGALLVPVGRLEILKLYPKRILIPILSFITIPGLIGPLIGPVIGGFLVEYASWHWIFLINLPIGAVCFILCYYWLPDKRAAHPHSFDGSGFILFSSAILIFSVANSARDASLELKAVLVAASLFLSYGYYFHARRKTHPLFGLKIFSIRTFSVGLIANLVARVSGGAMPFLTPLMLQVALGYSPAKAGLIMLVIGLTAIVGKTFAARLIKRLGYKRYLVLITVFLSLSTAQFALIGHGTHYTAIVCILGMFGILNSLLFTGLTTLPLVYLPQERTSEGNTLLSVAMQISSSFGVSIAAASLGLFEGRYHAATLTAFHWTYLVLAAASVASTLTFLLLPGRQLSKAQTPS